MTRSRMGRVGLHWFFLRLVAVIYETVTGSGPQPLSTALPQPAAAEPQPEPSHQAQAALEL